MKKLVCMALSAALLAGSVPAYAADYITKVPHTFTAKVGTTEFTKDGAAQPLDVAIYTKNGYTMLPLRTFMNAVLQIHPNRKAVGERGYLCNTRYRNVTICARVQGASGLKVFAPVPPVMPFSAAQSTASW